MVNDAVPKTIFTNVGAEIQNVCFRRITPGVRKSGSSTSFRACIRLDALDLATIALPYAGNGRGRKVFGKEQLDPFWVTRPKVLTTHSSAIGSSFDREEGRRDVRIASCGIMLWNFKIVGK